MPQIQKFTSPNVDPDDEIANVDDTVGIAGGGAKPSNAVGDVMLVQALLELNSQFTFRWATRPVKVDGIFSRDTGQLIFDFQDMIRKRPQVGFWVSKDGRVGRAKDGVTLLARQEWTIIALNVNPGLVAAVLGFNSVIEAIQSRHPNLVPHLRRAR